MSDEAAKIGHLLRRAGFGLSRSDRDEYLGLGYRAVKQRLLEELDLAPRRMRDFDAYVPGAIQTAWLQRMLSGHAPLAEKLALFWHGHFATSNAKVRDPGLMWEQMTLFRLQGGGRFVDLLAAVSRDPAMIRWLDGNANRREHPNENYAREVQELFTLGVGHFSERDVREAARAFSGWGAHAGRFSFSPRHHDDGKKRFHGKTGKFDGDDVVAIVTSLPRCHEYLAGRLLLFFATPRPSPADVRALATVSRRTKGDVRSMLKTLLDMPCFEQPRTLVRGPVELLVGALRAVGASDLPDWSHASLKRMGQTLFRPPSVKGWTSGTGWLGTSAILERFKVAAAIGRETPKAAGWIGTTAFDDRLPPRLGRALASAASDAERVTIALASPEFQRA
ncbi:MAG: DUF1800 domain-containing protein [Planctomycetota bacterium]|jgi:uncharacterized protein (DUF1800 family)